MERDVVAGREGRAPGPEGCNDRTDGGAMKDRLARWTSAGVVAGTLVLVASIGPELVRAGSSEPQDGLDRLRARLGSFTPTGRGVSVLQVEAGGEGPGEWTLGALEGFRELSIEPVGPRSAPAGHAAMVAQAMLSLAPGIERIYTGSSRWFLVEVLQAMQTAPPRPLPPGTEIVMCAWVGGSGAADVDILRRIDFMVNQAPFTLVAGMKPGSHLMGSAYNGISVGGAGASAGQGTSKDLDGPGRCKPDLVTGEGAASPATGRVAGGVALLLDAAGRLPRLRKVQDSRRPEVLKAALLAGAVRERGWTNLPSPPAPPAGDPAGVAPAATEPAPALPPVRSTSQPLDRAVGAGRMDVARAFEVLGAGSQGWSDPDASLAPSGWTMLSWRGTDGAERREESAILRLEQDAGEVAVVACWNRVVVDAQTWTLSDVDLRIERVDGGGTLDWASSGNPVSESRVDNVEMILLRDVRAGDYRIVATLRDGAPSAVAVAWLVSGPSARRVEPSSPGG